MLIKLFGWVDPEGGVVVDSIEEVDGVGVAEADAAVGGGGAESVFVVGAVDVDVAVVCVDVVAGVEAGFEAAEPEDAGAD